LQLCSWKQRTEYLEPSIKDQAEVDQERSLL
jgi:hypothetical protein